ncbi:hypothetical protein Agau_P100135 (plasmid) [Agrobacterium tumefaciens F2]|nr:hypothetical protein Agau_P100135 [Agrobacterium tumefaciens F2]
MAVRVGRVFAHVMMGCKPRRPACGNLFGVTPDQFMPLRGREFLRQSQHDLVGNARVFPAPVFRTVKKPACAVPVHRQACAVKVPQSAIAGDVVHVRTGRVRTILRTLSDRLVVQTVDRHSRQHLRGSAGFALQTHKCALKIRKELPSETEDRKSPRGAGCGNVTAGNGDLRHATAPDPFRIFGAPT